MASRRKKKRNRQLRDLDQNGSMSHGKPDDATDYDDFDYDAQYNTDYDTDNDDYDDVDREDDDTPVAGQNQEKYETAPATIGTNPPPFPKQESEEDSPGPHIKFPPNAKRKSTPLGDKLPKKSSISDASGPKKPNFLKHWLKKDKATDRDEPAGESSKRVAKKRTGTKTDEEILATGPKRRRRIRLFWCLFMLAMLIWALPLIVTKTPLLNVVLSKATADLEGTAKVKSVSCGWFSGISVEGIDIKDRQGNTVIEIPSVEGDRSLLGLLWNRSILGHFKLEKPTVHIVLGPDGVTNLETLIANYLEGPSDSDPMDLGIEVIDAKVTVSAADPAVPDSKPQSLLTLSDVNASVKTFADPDAPVSTSVVVKANVDAGKKVEPGQFSAELGLGRQNQLKMDAKQVVFDRFTPLLARVASGLELQGSLNGKLDCYWETASDADDSQEEKSSATDDLSIVADVQLHDFSATGGPLGSDRLVLSKPKLACELSGKDGVYILRQANLDSEVATLALEGQMVLDANMFGNTGKNAEAGPAANGTMATQTFNMNGRVDLARLANMLPTTLHLQDQTQVHSGKLTLNLSATEGKNLAPLASGATPLVWNAKLETSDLTAMRYSKELKWHQPITITLDAHQADQVGAVVDYLLCESDFLRIEAEGSVERFNAAGRFDLNKLIDKLGGFVDLGGLTMRGEGWANLSWRRVATQNDALAQGNKPATKDGFALDGDCQLRDLEISVAQPNVSELGRVGNPTLASSGSYFQRPWREPQVILVFSATGRMPTDGPVSLAGGEVRIRSGQEQIQGRFNEQIIAHLTAPVPEVSSKTVWPIAVNAYGQLGRWSDRARAFGIANDWFAKGNYDAKLGGSYAAENVKFDHVSVKVDQLDVKGPSVNFREPQLVLTLKGNYDRPHARWLINQAKCQTSAAMLTAEDLIVGTPAGKPLELAGTVGIEGDLARMQNWIADPRQPSTWNYRGYLQGSARLKQVDGIVSGQLEGALHDLQLSDRAGHRFHEKKLIVAADGKYNNASRVVEFTNARLTSSVVKSQIKGKLNSGDDPMQSDLAGTMECDMQRLSELLLPYVGPGIAFQGKSNNTLKLAGPMTLDRLNAKAGVGWDSALVYGFQLGKGKLDFTLADGLLSSSPLQMPVSGGRVNLAPQLRVAPGAMQLEVPPGMVAENVEINPQMCTGGLKYIAPVLADAAVADGRFSLYLDQCQLPIDNLASGKLAGRFIVHSMTVGAGPLIQQLAPVLKNAATPAKLQKESVVPFQMVNGRIYHKDLELIFPDITIKTHGSVGLVDQSMNIVAEMPVPQKWIDQTGGSIRPALQGQKVTIPIAGTLSRPRLNQHQMNQAMQQFVGKAATNVLEKEGRSLINQGLNQLFGPQKR